jgi:hypothetical protein
VATEDMKINKYIDNLSDQLYQMASDLVDRHSLLTSAQANGLLNIVNCENLITTVTAYIQNQATKSTTKDPQFWSTLKKELEGLRKLAEEIQAALGDVPPEKKKQQDQRNEIHLLLAREYVRHLVAHNIYKSALNGGR